MSDIARCTRRMSSPDNTSPYDSDDNVPSSSPPAPSHDENKDVVEQKLEKLNTRLNATRNKVVELRNDTGPVGNGDDSDDSDNEISDALGEYDAAWRAHNNLKYWVSRSLQPTIDSYGRAISELSAIMNSLAQHEEKRVAILAKTTQTHADKYFLQQCDVLKRRLDLLGPVENSICISVDDLRIKTL